MITGRDIGERFIRAVQIMEGLYSVGPSQGKSAWVDIPHTQADKNGWGSERLAQERQAFWNSLNRSPRPWEVSEAEETLGWLSFVEKEEERLCLTAWARCMAKNGIFKDWCKRNDIHPETGRRRKERAILRILLVLDRKPLLHNENDIDTLLCDAPETGHKSINIGEGATTWMGEDSRPLRCYFDTDLDGFDWATKRNELRRQREARKRQQEAA